MSNNRVLNFGAGPAKIPQSVLKKAQDELLDFDHTGMSILEISHRTKPFANVMARTKESLRQLLDIPDNYDILFMQGGASTQFAAVFYNLLAAKQEELRKLGREKETIVVDYFVTGTWSARAAVEAERLAATVSQPVHVNRVVDVKQQTGQFGSIPSTWNLTDPAKNNVAYVYYCDNETIHGVEFPQRPEIDPSVPLVADISSNFLSRPMDVSKHGVIYGGAQKNLGPAGVSIIIIRKDLLTDLSLGPVRPLMLDYATMAKHDSMYNTPPTFAIYIVGLTLEWLLEQGGLSGIEEANARKAKKLYDVIEQSKIYTSPVQAGCRSRMNVVFRLTEALEKEFLAGAEARNMVQLKGHRSVGGVRASIYNATPEEDVDILIDYMKEFEKEHTK
ncbi:phosphoserine aminotransferase [Radiomyces spectabilis]|uniref:phosphoserine aminotransferase n=1 Tax=Radiomyces spectabilis TaxID=64574 RepID=UPI00221EFA4F|nr:phosphoserine aminotransferase [Radiomyces spectabilis]KAI8384643.1 phosphoserine aminotransferase [Radiomyces spectabilis]